MCDFPKQLVNKPPTLHNKYQAKIFYINIYHNYICILDCKPITMNK